MTVQYHLAAVFALAIIFGNTGAKPQTSNAIDFSEERTNEEDRYKAVIQELCKHRPANEYFRLSTESNCRDVVRCVPNDFVGGHTLAAVRCPTGLLFDLDGQVCDWAARVQNCDKLTKPLVAEADLGGPRQRDVVADEATSARIAARPQHRAHGRPSVLRNVPIEHEAAGRGIAGRHAGL